MLKCTFLTRVLYDGGESIHYKCLSITYISNVGENRFYA